MKKTTRISALILVLALFLNLFGTVYAVAEGVRLEDLDVSTYQMLMARSAEADENSGDSTVLDDPLGIGGKCGEDYCLYITETMVNMTAQEIHKYLNALYYEGLADGEEGPSDAYTILMMHYGIYHQDLGLVCTCGNHPMDAPETFEVGDISKHETTCPWHFSNLSVEDQYDVSIVLASYDEEVYMACLEPEQQAAFAVYSANMQGPELTDPCGEGNSYCQIITEELAKMSAKQVYNYLSKLYTQGLAEGEEGPSEAYTALMLHYAFKHLDMGIICTCGEHPLMLPEYELTDVSAHEKDCPWHFNKLTTAEQYELVSAADDVQKAEFESVMSDGVAEKLSRVNVSEYTAEADAAIVQIKVPDDTFEKDYILTVGETDFDANKESALAEAGFGNVLASFDISFPNLYDEMDALQPVEGANVPLAFTVDTSKLAGKKLNIVHLKENSDGTYTAELMGEFDVDASMENQTFTVYAEEFSPWLLAEGSCDGTACYTNGTTVISVDTLSKQNPLERYATLIGLYDEGTTLETMLWHLIFEHEEQTQTLLCGCTYAEYMMYAPGSSRHEEDCPWAADALGTVPSAEELYSAYQKIDVVGKAYYLSGMDDSQRLAMETLMSAKEKEDKDYLDDEGMKEWLNEEGVAKWLKTDEIAAWRSDKAPAAETLVLAKIALESNADLELIQAMAINRKSELMWLYEDQAMATINENGYVIDIATGIAVGRYDSENESITLGTGSN